MKKIILLLMMNVVLFGNTHIGTPYMERGEGKIESVVTSSSSESFFTLNDGEIIKWQISPPKKLHSFSVNIDRNKRYTIYITPNDKTLLLHSKDDISIWDTKTGTLIKRVNIKSLSYNKMDLKAAVGTVDGYVFYSLSEDFILHKWDINTLKLVEIQDMTTLRFSRGPWEEEGNCTIFEKPIYLLSSKNTIIYFTANIIYVLDKKTYKVIRKTYTEWIHGGFIPISIDSNYLYYVKLEMKNHFQTRNYMKYDIKHDRELMIKADAWRKEIKSGKRFYKKTNLLKHYKKQSDFNGTTIVYTKVKATEVSMNDFRYNLYKISNGKYIASLYIYNNDVLFLVKSDGTFESSKNAMMYFKMKLPTGEILPINEETYKKFNQIINIKE